MFQQTSLLRMKWLTRVAKKRTPMPPKPYEENEKASNLVNIARERDYFHADLDPELPHWRDPKFETREKVPWWDFFGFNRNYSLSIFKVFATMGIGLVCFNEFKAVTGLGVDLFRITSAAVQPTPDFARDDIASEKELREAGFAYVGLKHLDSVHSAREDAKEVRKG